MSNGPRCQDIVYDHLRKNTRATAVTILSLAMRTPTKRIQSNLKDWISQEADYQVQPAEIEHGFSKVCQDKFNGHNTRGGRS